MEDEETELADGLKLLGPAGQCLNGVGAELWEEAPNECRASRVACRKRVCQVEQVLGEPFKGFLKKQQTSSYTNTNQEKLLVFLKNDQNPECL